MIPDHDYKMYVDEQYKWSSNDLPMFICHILHEYRNLVDLIDKGQIKGFHWDVYTDVTGVRKLFIHYTTDFCKNSKSS